MVATLSHNPQAASKEEFEKGDHNNNNRVKISKGLEWYYLQYCLITGLYMLEPWERALFNSFVLFCLAVFIEMGDGKVELLLKAVGDAPIMKQGKWKVDSKKTIAELTAFIQQYLKIESGESIFLYVNQCFAPSPDQTVGNLSECFGCDESKLVLHYSKTYAWG